MVRSSILTMDEMTGVLFGHSAFQYLNAGCELGLFTLLHEEPGLDKSEIASKLGLAERSRDVLLLGTTSLRLTRVSEDGRYRNAKVIDQLFDDGEWQDFANIVAFEQYITYLGQVDFTESLRTNTNAGLRRVPGAGRDLYHRLHENPELEKVFYRYMHSWSEISNRRLLENIDFGLFNKVLDMGGGTGVNAIALARKFPQLNIEIFEIPPTVPITQDTIDSAELSDRVTVFGGDFFADEYPTGHDCVLFSHQLVIWTPEQNVDLLRRAYDSLPDGGSVVIFNSMSDDAGDGPLMAALDSVYFAAIPAEGGMIYSFAQYEDWARQAGFASTRRINCHAWTPHGIVIATK